MGRSVLRAEELARALRMKRRNGYWHGRCPVHHDRSPSLSVTEKEGRVKVRCFAGCDARMILSKLGLTFRDLGWESNPRWKERLILPPPSPRVRGPKRRLGEPIAVYRYTNIYGDLLAEKLRFEGKVFLWRRPQSGGGWIWKVDRESLPLYRLHEIHAAKKVCIVEGEKDADRLREIIREGWAVTTAPNGSNSWRKEYAQYLAGKRVLLIPDTDKPGMEYAARIAEDIRPLVQSIHYLSVAPDKDISDYLKTHSMEELRIAAKNAERW
jgi:5S rRNA maturation endonuclease (ribonuclease M5)